MIQFEKEIINYLKLPGIPKRVWDGLSSFDDGVAVVNLTLGNQAYAVCAFNSETDREPRIKKVFAQEPFGGIEKVFVVPSYMETSNISDADLDEQSKEAAKRLADEAEDLTQGVEEETPLFGDNLPEYFFDKIHNDEEAMAFIASYNKDNGIRGVVPTKHDTLVMRLGVIYSDLQKKNKK